MKIVKKNILLLLILEEPWNLEKLPWGRKWPLGSSSANKIEF